MRFGPNLSGASRKGQLVTAPQISIATTVLVLLTSAAAIAVVDKLQVYFGSSELSKNLDTQLNTMEVAILKFALAKHVQGTLDRFFQRQCHICLNLR